MKTRLVRTYVRVSRVESDDDEAWRADALVTFLVLRELFLPFGKAAIS